MLLKDRAFIRSLAAIAIPVALQSILVMAVNIADSVMVGKLGDIAMSAVALAGQPFFFIMIVSFGCTSGGSVLISQYWGKKDLHSIRRLIGIVYRVIMTLAIAACVACVAAPHFILSLLTDQPEIIELGTQYLRVVALSFPLFAFSSAYTVSLRSVQKVNISTISQIVAFFVNIGANYIFIFGKFGFPELGVVGAAVGTVIARVADVIVAMVYMLFFEKDIKFRPKHIFIRDKLLFHDYIRNAAPVICTEFLWSLGTVVQSSIIGHLGAVFVSANSIAGNAQQIAMVGLNGVGNAGAVLIGMTIGEGKIERVKKMAKTLLVFAIGVAAVSSVLILIMREFVPGFFNVSEAARQLSYQMMGVLSIVVFFQSLDFTCLISIIRGSGDTRFGFFVDSGAMWLVSIPIGYLAAFVWKLPYPLVYFMLRCDMPVKIAISLPRIFKGNYIKIVTRDNKNINNLTSDQ